MQRADSSDARDPKEIWQETFHRDNATPEAGKDDESKSPPREKIAGLGNEAFWAPHRFGGALYVLKDNTYISISIGGSGDQASKIQKSKALAEKILNRL